MPASTPSPIRVVVAHLVAAYPRAEIREETVSVYERLLADLPSDELRAAAVELARTSPHFPTVSDLAGLVLERRLRLPPAEEAWEIASRHAALPEGWEPCPTCKGRVQPEPCTACADQGRVE